MGRTSVGTREVRDGTVRREDMDITTPGQSTITKIVAGSDVSLAWTGADPGTGDVTVSFVGGASTAIPLESYELADWYGGQNLSATPITLDFDSPRFPNNKFNNVNGELEFLEAGPYLILARATVSITDGTSRSTSQMVLEEDTGSGWTTVWGTEAFMYHRTLTDGKDTGTSLLTYNAAVGDKIRIRLTRVHGSSTLTTEDDGSNLIVVSLKGTRGDQGPQGIQGNPGLNGTDGLDGTDGIDGSLIYTGAGAPSNTLGNDGDLYINTSNNEYYQKGSTTSGDWGSPIGVMGSGGSGVSDHGALTGLGDDDHPQYFTQNRGDARYSLLGHTHPELSNLDLNQQKLETLYWMG